MPVASKSIALRARACVAAMTLLAASGCGRTVDSIGYDRQPLGPLLGPSSYPNAFRDVLGKSDADISAKIDAAFEHLFHGDPATQAIYFPFGADQAYIVDVLHGDVRTEGIGYGMIIAVELDKRDEFDRLWAYAKTVLRYTSGPDQGYFFSWCDTSAMTSIPCIDPFGLEQFTMALVFAHDRWGSEGAIDYQADAEDLFELMLHKEDQNGGIVGGVTNTFDASTKLVFDTPSTASAGFTRPAVEMPAYYELWAQATENSFFRDAAASARAYWEASANPTTGLWPIRATFQGAPVANNDSFAPDVYRAMLNMVIDQVWQTGDSWEVDQANRLLGFFASKGIDQYCESYTLDGATCLNLLHDPSLVAVNGATALISNSDQRTAFIQAAWDVVIPSDNTRYYTGLLDMLSMLILSGQFRVY